MKAYNIKQIAPRFSDQGYAPLQRVKAIYNLDKEKPESNTDFFITTTKSPLDSVLSLRSLI